MIERREFLRLSAVAGLAALYDKKWVTRSQPVPVVVVGAGLAGLTAAYRIYRRTGLAPLIIEAAEVPGGRVRTVRSIPGGGYCESGGTFISTGDRAIRRLMAELDVGSVDLDALWPSGGYTYYFDGRARSPREVFRGWGSMQRAAERQFERIDWPLTFSTANEASMALDRVTIAEWIERFIDDEFLARYMTTYMETDYGTPPNEGSALHIVADLAAPGRSYDERFLIKGGSEVLITALVRNLLPGTVRTSAVLRSVTRHNDRLSLVYETGGELHEIDARVVVLALPFTSLRNVDLSRAGFSSRKLEAIENLGMGAGVKVNLAFNSAPWREQGSGDSVSDLSTGWTWPGHVGQDNTKKLMVALTTTDVPGPTHGELPLESTSVYMDALETMFPGTGAASAGWGYIDRWSMDPLIGGTYSYYKAGTFTDVAGVESIREGRVIFAGEHTAAYGNRGTMNGAVASGERAAAQVIEML
jgi:monoamine oxidase